MPRARRWPPIPTSYDGILGPIAVRRVPKIIAPDGDTPAGLWLPDTREILVRESRSRVNEWFFYYHEEAHSIWDDMCVPLPTKGGADSIEERTCNAYAHARVREMARSLGLTVPQRR